jgi:hypothetical protein
MTEQELEKLKYPIGQWSRKEDYSAEETNRYINVIEEFPAKIRKTVEKLTITQLDAAYRPEGWTVRQVIHHVADSHMNAFMRIKLALTEEHPSIKPYFEERWAKLADYKSEPNVSLDLLDNLHKRWVMLLRSLNESELELKYFHPESNEDFSVRQVIHLYAWHCSHHLAHITELKKRKEW